MLAACSREADPQPEAPAERPIAGLPPATSIGARTGGMLINGQPWVAQSNLHQRTVYSEFGDGHILFLEMLRYVQSPRASELLALHVPNVQGEGSYPIVARVTYRDSNEFFGVYFRDYVVRKTYVPDTGTTVGTLEITRFDLNARIISGRFHFRLPHPDGELVVTEGRFDTTIEINP